MTQSVVDGLELAEVEKEKRQRTLEARLGQQTAGVLVQGAAVQQSGERVVAGVPLAPQQAVSQPHQADDDQPEDHDDRCLLAQQSVLLRPR
nr:hypothetical protein [Blastococcus colisei]